MGLLMSDAPASFTTTEKPQNFRCSAERFHSLQKRGKQLLNTDKAERLQARSPRAHAMRVSHLYS